MDPQKTPQPPVRPDQEAPEASEPQQAVTPSSTTDMNGLEAETPATPESPSATPGATIEPEDLTQQPSSESPATPLSETSGATTIAPEATSDPTTITPATEIPSTPTPAAPVPSTGIIPDAPEPTATENPTIVPPVGPVLAPAKPKRKKWITALIIVATIIILSAGAAAAYVGFIMPNQPKYVLARALGNTVTASKLHSASFDGSFELKHPESSQTFSGVFSGQASDTAFDGKLTLDAGVTKIGINMLTSDSKDLYLKVSGLDGVPELLTQMGGEAIQYAPLVQSFNNQWFVINESLIKASGLVEMSEDQYGLSDADAKKIETAYRNHLFWDVTKTYEDIDVHGTPSFHYQAKINEKELEAFLKEVKSQNIKNLKITDEHISVIKQSDLDKYPMEVWIAKDSRIINKVALDLEEEGNAMHFETSLFDLNKKVAVENPADAKSLLELLAASQAGQNIQALLNQKTDGLLEEQAQVN